MRAHPVSRLIRFTLAVSTNVIFDHLLKAAYSPSRAHDRGCRGGCLPRLQHRRADRQRLTYGGVERYLAQLAAHPGTCGCGRCVLALRVTAQRVFAIASGWQRQVRATRVRAFLGQLRRSFCGAQCPDRAQDPPKAKIRANDRDRRTRATQAPWGDQDPRDRQSPHGSLLRRGACWSPGGSRSLARPPGGERHINASRAGHDPLSCFLDLPSGEMPDLR